MHSKLFAPFLSNDVGCTDRFYVVMDIWARSWL